jgi:hypothetical protein
MHKNCNIAHQRPPADMVQRPLTPAETTNQRPGSLRSISFHENYALLSHSIRTAHTCSKETLASGAVDDRSPRTLWTTLSLASHTHTSAQFHQSLRRSRAVWGAVCRSFLSRWHEKAPFNCGVRRAQHWHHSALVLVLPVLASAPYTVYCRLHYCGDSCFRSIEVTSRGSKVLRLRSRRVSLLFGFR